MEHSWQCGGFLDWDFVRITAGKAWSWNPWNWNGSAFQAVLKVVMVLKVRY
jgi:hypothetical protein